MVGDRSFGRKVVQVTSIMKRSDTDILYASIGRDRAMPCPARGVEHGNAVSLRFALTFNNLV